MRRHNTVVVLLFWSLFSGATMGLRGPPLAFLVSNFERAMEHAELGPLFLKSVAEKENEVVRLCYVPTAMFALKADSVRSPGRQRSQSRRDARLRREKIVATMGASKTIEAVTVDVFDGSLADATWPVESAMSAIETADFFVVDGGNTFWLWACLEPYADAVRRSKATYVGVSAGAIVYGRHLSTALWKGWDDPGVVEPPRDWTQVRGLDMALAKSFFPHHSQDFHDLFTRNSHQAPGVLPLDEEGGCCLFKDQTRNLLLEVFQKDHT